MLFRSKQRIVFKQDQIKVAKLVLQKRKEKVKSLRTSVQRAIKLMKFNSYQTPEFQQRKADTLKALKSTQAQVKYWTDFVGELATDLEILENMDESKTSQFYYQELIQEARDQSEKDSLEHVAKCAVAPYFKFFLS